MGHGDGVCESVGEREPEKEATSEAPGASELKRTGVPDTVIDGEGEMDEATLGDVETDAEGETVYE